MKLSSRHSQRDIIKSWRVDGGYDTVVAFDEGAHRSRAKDTFRDRTIRQRHTLLEWVAVIARAQDRAAEVRGVAKERAREFFTPPSG